MVIIISEDSDKTTTEVIKWLTSIGAKAKRINSTSLINGVSISLAEKDISIHLNVDSDVLRLDTKSFFWYRKGTLNFNLQLTPEDSPVVETAISSWISYEWKAVKNFILQSLSKNRFLGNYDRAQPNKLEVLAIARELGIEIPPTFVVDTKAGFEAASREKSLVTKPIQDLFEGVFGDRYYRSLTVDTNSILDEGVPDYFFPSLIQENIKKKYELRIFFFDEKYYAMAILSSGTQDWRGSKNLRMVPFNLPSHIINKLRDLSRELKLNTGSLDMIVTNDNSYYFLEVNPCGQFDMMSFHCNYYIERDLAKYMSHEKVK